MKLEVITREPEGNARTTPILFVHGMFHGAWCWEEHFLPFFAQRGYAAHALSLRGHAGSEGCERLRWTSLADYVSDLGQVVNQLPRPPVLVGHSMGGMITQKYLQSHQSPAAVLLASISPIGLLSWRSWVSRWWFRIEPKRKSSDREWNRFFRRPVSR